MPLKAKLAVALVASMVLLGGLLYFFLPGRPEAPEAAPNEAEIAAAPAVEVAAPERPAAPAAKPVVARKAAKDEPPPAVSRVVVSPGGWTLTGRIVRESGSAVGKRDPAAAAPAPDAGAVPVAGAVIHLKPHPRRTRPEQAPPPRKVLTGPDGTFELVGVPAGVWLRLEVDEPSSAYRTLSFSLNQPGAESRRDLGDLPIVPGASLTVKLLGPADEPIAKGTILVNRDASAAGRSEYLQSLGFGESRREAEERENGVYVLDRVALGPIYLEAKAPGYAPSERVAAELPREEPVVIHLQEGVQIAGTVLTVDGRPVAGAELEVYTRNDPHRARSDDSGKFVFDTLGPGTYDLTASADGFVSTRANRVNTGTADVEITLVPEAVFAGRVIAEEDEKPIVKAKVTLRNPQSGSSFSADSDEQGSFAIKKVPAGSYLVVADHRDFAPSDEEARELKEGENVSGLTLRLPRGFAVTGKVVEAKSQAPVPEAQVSFQLRDPAKGGTNLRRTGNTDSEGAFEVKGLREGTYAVTASAKGYFTARPLVLTITPGNARGITITVEQASSIAGTVLDVAGSPVAGATLRLNVAMPEGPFNDWNEFNQKFQNLSNISAQSAGDGRYRLEGLVPHSGYVVQASHRDYAPASFKGIEVGPRESVEGVDLRLSRGGTIRGRVLDEKGVGISGATVNAGLDRNAAGEQEENRYYFGYSSGGNATSDAEGSYALQHLPAGVHTVQAQARDRASASRDKVAVAEGGEAEGVDLVLGAGEILAGRVLDAQGSPIAGATVRRYDGNAQEVRTDAEGRFELKGLNQGRLHYGVSASGYLGVSQQATLPAGEVSITLQRSAKVAGTVRAAGAAGLSSFQISALSTGGPGGNSFGTGQNDPTGKFEIEVGSGTYYLTATAPGFAPGRSTEFTVKEGDRLEGLVIELDKGATVEGVVVAAASGQPLAGVSVSLVVSPQEMGMGGYGWGGLPAKTTGDDGTFVLDGLPEGQVTLSAAHRQYAQATVQVQVTRDRVATARIALSEGGAIRGLALRGGVPPANARVNCYKVDGAGQYVGKDAVVDAQGRFEIKGLAAGEYMVAVMVSSGRRGAMSSRNQRQVTVVDGQTTEVDLSEGAGVRLSGRVLSGGAPVSGGMIMAMQPQKNWNGGNAEIEAGGAYTIELPGPGEYFFLVQREGGREAGAKVKVTVPEGGNSFDYDLELPSGQLSGVVVDAETGAAVPNAQVIALAAGAASRSFLGLFQAMQSMGQTDGQGAFVISNLPEGTFVLRAFAESYADARIEGLRLAEGGSLGDLRIALERGVSYRLRVVDPRGQPVAQAVAMVRDSGGELVAFTRPAFSNPQGIMEIQGIRPGAYRITIQHRSYASTSIQEKVGSEVEGPTVTLRPGGRLQVEVVNQKARPVEGAEVEILNEQGENIAEELMIFGMGPTQAGLTNASGSVVLDQLAPGTYRAAARHGAARSRVEKLSVSEGETAETRLTISE